METVSTYQFVGEDTCLELEFQNAGRVTKIGLLNEIVNMSFLPWAQGYR